MPMAKLIGGAMLGGAAAGAYYMFADAKPIPKIIISGGPASGKGTQCELIVDKYGCKHISTGDALRHHVKMKTDLGKEAKGYMDRGDLVPDELVINICKAEMDTDEAKQKGWLLDGMPRTAVQSQALTNMGLVPNLFLLLECPDSVMIERACGRRMDPETRKIYHLKYAPPENDEIAKRLIQRSDDTEEKMGNRIIQYHKNVDAVKGCYTDITAIVSSNRAKAAIFEDVYVAIDKAVFGK